MPPTIQDSPAPPSELESHPAPARRNPALRGPVLLATDGTSQSGAAVIAARVIADRLGVPLEVVTVLEPQIVYSAMLGGMPVYVPELEKSQKEGRMSEVLAYIARHSQGGASPRIDVRCGVVALEVAEAARERGATLIVVGAAPHQRLNRIVAGERALQVLRSSTVPVLSVPPGFTVLPRHVAVAVDFSPASIRAAQAALLLVADGGTLTLLHVISLLLADVPLRNPTGRDPESSVQTLFARLRDELRPYVPQGVAVETRVTTEHHIDGILKTAMRLDAELVVVGTHGPRLLERLFVGSVAASVIHAAPQAVLAAPPPPPGEAMDLWLRLTGNATSVRPRGWAGGLDEFTRRNKGRRVAVEVDDLEIGAQMLARGALLGVTYDPHDCRVEIMVGDAHRARRHLMHSIPNVDSVSMTTDERSGSEALELRHGQGRTLVLVGP